MTSDEHPNRADNGEKVERFDTLVSDSGALPWLITIPVSAPFPLRRWKPRARALFTSPDVLARLFEILRLEFGEQLHVTSGPS